VKYLLKSHRALLIALLAFTAWLALLGALRLAQRLNLGFPFCAMRVLTGIPCPTCGATRALLAWSRLEVTQAFRFNPLVALACVVLCLWVGVALLDACFHKDWAKAAWHRVSRKPWPAALIGAAIVNWVYLILHLPR
jgi:hypothetical protein